MIHLGVTTGWCTYLLLHGVSTPWCGVNCQTNKGCSSSQSNNHSKYCTGTVAEVNQTRVRRELIYLVKALDLYTGQVNCELWPVDRPCGGMLAVTCPGGVRFRDESRTGGQVCTVG